MMRFKKAFSESLFKENLPGELQLGMDHKTKGLLTVVWVAEDPIAVPGRGSSNIPSEEIKK